MTWDFLLRGSTTVLFLGGFAAALSNACLTKRENRKRKIIIWLICMVVLVLARFGMDHLEQLVQQLLFDGQADRGLAGVIYSSVDAFVSFLLPPIAVVIGTMLIYDSRKSVKIFISSFAGFWACVLHEYPFELMRLPFLGADRGDGLRERPPVWLNTLILAVCVIFFYLLYKHFLNEYFRKVIEMTNGDFRSFVLIPLFCCVVLMILLSVLEGNNIEITSADSHLAWIFVLTVGALIFLFVLLYWSLFRGLTLSTAAMASKAELDVATQIQLDMLPKEFPRRQEFDLYAATNPAREVGGDFYDFYMVDDRHLAMVIADVSGKGVPAALFMSISKILLKITVLRGFSPKEVLESVNNQLCENNEADMFVTVWIGIMDIDTGKVVAANAGHEYPAVRKADGTFTLMQDKHGLALGALEDMQYEEYEFTVEAGGSVFVYTDGVAEAMDKDGHMYETDRMLEALNQAQDADPRQLIENVAKSIDAFVGTASQFDDITMLAMKRN